MGLEGIRLTDPYHNAAVAKNARGVYAQLFERRTNCSAGLWPTAMKLEIEARREEIRESRPKREITCSVCEEIMRDADEGAWHFEDHEGKPVREHYALLGNEDDLGGYEDYDEGDYCEGDDDGYDCEMIARTNPATNGRLLCPMHREIA